MNAVFDTPLFIYSEKLKDWIFVKITGIVHQPEYGHGEYDYELTRVMRDGNTGVWYSTKEVTVKRKTEIITKAFKR